MGDRVRIPKRSLEAMHRRWSKDLARLQAAFPSDWGECTDPEAEVQRNLATAIVEMEMLLGQVPYYDAATKDKGGEHGRKG